VESAPLQIHNLAECHTCPPGMGFTQNFISLLICEDQMLLFAMPFLTTKNDAASLKKICCLIVVHWDQLPFLSPIVTPWYFILSNIKVHIIYLSDISVQSFYNMNVCNLNTKIYCGKQKISAECFWRPIFAKITLFSNSCKGTTYSTSTRISQNMKYTYKLLYKNNCGNP
jgi:hypothetical protein